MRKVALFVSSARLESLFRQSKIFSNIKNDYDITIFYFNSENSYVYDKSQKLFAIKSTRFLAKFQKFILDIESYHSRKINVSFESRIRVITNLSIKHDLRAISFIKVKNFYGVCLSIFSNALLYSSLSSLMRFASDIVPLITNPRLIFTKFELGIILSGGNFSSMENTVGRLLKFRQIPNLLLVDNWDNLSSKSVLWNKPSKILVWGENMKEDAVQVHNIKEENVVIAGSYRLIYPSEQGFQAIDKFIYFIGSGLQHSHEIEILMHLSVNLSMCGDTGIKIVYRPHPFSIRNQNFQYLLQQLSHFSNIQVDSDIILNESNAFYSESSLSHLALMTLKSEFIVATHSTVIVEALYFGKRVIAFSGAEYGVFSTQNIWDMYTHLKQIENFSNLTVAVERVNFFKEVLRSLQNPVILEPVNFSAISRNTKNYDEILSEVSFDLISKR